MPLCDSCNLVQSLLHCSQLLLSLFYVEDLMMNYLLIWLKCSLYYHDYHSCSSCRGLDVAGKHTAVCINGQHMKSMLSDPFRERTIKVRERDGEEVLFGKNSL